MNRSDPCPAPCRCVRRQRQAHRPDGGHPGDDSGSGATAQPLYKAVVLGADYSSGTGIVSRLDLATLSMQTNAIAGVATSDPVMRQIGDKLYIVNRSVGENVTILDAGTLSPVGQYSTGANSNPQDVAVVGDKLYVPATGTAGVVVMTLPAGTTTTIALDTAVGDPDGKPDCVAAFAVGTMSTSPVTCSTRTSRRAASARSP